MPNFSSMSAEDVGRYVAANLTTAGNALKVAFNGGSKEKAPIYEIASNLLPHSMYLFLNAIANQQKVVDGRKVLVRYDFLEQNYYGKPVFSSPAAKQEDGYAKKKTDWIDGQLRQLGRVPANKALSANERTELLRQLYKQKQDQLYGMRSVHLDAPGWLPAVAIPNALNAVQTAYRDYISAFTELPANMQEKAKTSAKTISAYVEYTAGNASADGEFAEPRWRVVYDWVNGRFFLTWHYQPNFFQRPDKSFIKSPWIHILHVAGSQGVEGPQTPAANPAATFKERELARRGLKPTDWA
jgi:hypothetical protein